MIIFKKIKARNFFSVGNNPIEIDLNKYKTVSISGANGSGKSALILDSIFFALFNKPFRNIRKPNVINSVNSSGMEIELSFISNKKSYVIKRGMKPYYFEIYENGNLINQDAAVRDYQKYLEENILNGLNEKVFKQVVVIGSADYQPFMQLRSHDRREIIEELLDITIFSHMLRITKDKLSDLKQKITDYDYKINVLSEKIKIHTNNLNKQKTNQAEKRRELENNISEYKNDIDANNNKIKEYNEKKIILENKLQLKKILVQSVKDMEQLTGSLSKSIKELKSQLQFFRNNDHCPACLQSISKEHINQITSDIITNVEKDSSKEKSAKEILKRKREALQEYENHEKLVIGIDKKIYEIELNIKQNESQIENNRKEIETLGTISNEDIIELNKLKQELQVFVYERKELIELQDYYYSISVMLKDTGIKSKIIEQYIPVINTYINDYLSRFGLPIHFTLDENFNEVIRSRFRDDFQYNNFSEGEKQRINIAILLSWRQLARSKNTINTNLLILDEVFDSSLDIDATEELLNILLQMDTNTNIFVVSHKNELSDKLEAHFRFYKQQNFTQYELII